MGAFILLQAGTPTTPSNATFAPCEACPADDSWKGFLRPVYDSCSLLVHRLSERLASQHVNAMEVHYPDPVDRAHVHY
jgi:hypothetical protein